MASFGDWAGDFFTGDWTNAYDANPWLTGGAIALGTLATGGLAAGALGAGAAGAGAAGLGAAEAGAAGLGAAEGAGALGFGAEAAGAGAEAGLPSWFAGLGEGGLAGGVPTAEAGGSLSEFLALTGPEGAGASAAEGPLAGTFGGAEDALAGAGSTGGLEGAASGGPLEFTGGGVEDALGVTGKEAGGQGWWDKIVSGATNQLTKNPLGIAAAGIGLGANMLKGSQDSPEMAALRGQAGDLSGQAKALNAQGQQLASYLQSGTLPPGLASSVKQATDAIKARIISNHAKNGMSTDPTQNSALAQELANAEMNAVSMTAALGQQLMQSGQNFLKMGSETTGLSERIYESLVRLDREQSRATGQAIASFAAALGGGTTLRLAA